MCGLEHKRRIFTACTGHYASNHGVIGETDSLDEACVLKSRYSRVMLREGESLHAAPRHAEDEDDDLNREQTHDAVGPSAYRHVPLNTTQRFVGESERKNTTEKGDVMMSGTKGLRGEKLTALFVKMSGGD